METIAENTIVRAPSMDDVGAVVDLINACAMVEIGKPDSTIDILRSEWQAPDADLERNHWLVHTPAGQLVGYAEIWDDAPHIHPYVFAQVHPDYKQQGIGTLLRQLAEARAQELIVKAPDGARVVLLNGINHVNVASGQLLADAGYILARHFWRMEVEMNGAPPKVVWSEGITIRGYVPGEDDRAVFEAMDEAFSDHWGYTPEPMDQWFYWMTEHGYHDPAVWFLAIDGDEIAGASLGRPEEWVTPDMGWISQLFVRRAWRRRGLGLALLKHSFAEFYKRDKRRVGLGVDSQNLTGATHLYEKAGMSIARQHDIYEKELRPGEELSVQSLEE